MSAATPLPPYLRDRDRVLAFAHRGGALHPELVGLENTARAFRHAVGLGYRYLETDVHVTLDGHLLAFHDDVLDRVTDQVGAIEHLTLPEIQISRIGGLEPVPTMAELFEEFPETRFNIDLKAPGAVEPLARLIDEYEAWDRVLVGAFSARRLRAFRRLAGTRVATSAHPWEVAAFRLLPSARLARRLSGRSLAAMQVPVRRGPLTIVTPGFVRRAHAAGLHVHVWTVDDAEQMHELLDLGVDALITDRTDILRDVLVERGLWSQRDGADDSSSQEKP